MALTSKTRVMEYLQIKKLTEADPLIEWLIDAVEARIKAKTRREQFESGAVTEYHDGDGVTSYFQTDEFPITAITSLHDDTDYPHTYGDGYLISTDDYIWYSHGEVALVTGTFNKGLKNIRIIYTAGYAAVPKDLEYLATKWVALSLKEKDRIGVSSQSGADGSLTVFDQFLDADMKEILYSYRSVKYY